MSDDQSESITHSMGDDFFLSNIHKETQQEQTFDPTTILADEHNCVLYKLWKRSSPGLFKSQAKKLLAKDETAHLAFEKAGLLCDYYYYAMEYMFSVRKWVPKGIKQ